MAPRITIHGSANGGKAWPEAQTASKGKKRLDEPPTPQQNDVDYESDGTDELGSLGHPCRPGSQSDLDDPSALQPQWETISTMDTSSKSVAKKPRQKPPTTRLPGQSLIPLSRVETVVQSDPDISTPSKEASFIITLATEEFIRRLTQVAHSRSKMDNRALTTYNDLADTAHYFEEFNFLKEIIPRTLTPKAALEERRAILERRDALLNGIGPENKHSNAASVSGVVQKTSPPTPKGQGRAKATTNGKTAAKSKGAASSATTPVVRSERRRNKRVRLSSDEGVSDGMSASAGPPTSTRSREPNDNASPNPTSIAGGSQGVGGGGGMKIKIRPRAMATDRHVPSKVLPPGPGDEQVPLSNGLHDKECPLSDAVDHLRLKADHNPVNGHREQNGPQGSGNITNTNDIHHVSAGDSVTDPTLWTRVPLPPPPSPVAHRIHENGEKIGADVQHDGGRPNRSQQSIREQVTKPQGRRRAAQSRTRRTSPLISQQEDATAVDFRDALSVAVPIPGRTIYSQR